MEKSSVLIQKADWKFEKHVPVIECKDIVKADEMFKVKVGIGKEIAQEGCKQEGREASYQPE